MREFNLPEKHEPYTDKYFLRSNQVLKGEGMNPYVKMQVFIRKGPGRVYGIEEAVAILDKYSNIRDKGRILALPEGSRSILRYIFVHCVRAIGHSFSKRNAYGLVLPPVRISSFTGGSSMIPVSMPFSQ